MKLLDQDSQLVHYYIKYIYLLSFLTTLLYGFILWYCVINGISDLSIFIIAVMIFGMSAGAISTLGSIYTAYLIFIVPNYIFLISAFIYHGGEMFDMFALTMSVMLVVLISAGKKNYITLRDAMSIKETLESIYENSSDGVVIFENRKLIRSNKAIVKMFKAPNEEKMIQNSMLKDKQILQQSRLAQMGEMISMIAHQWRQPLSAIASAGAIINLKAQLGKLDKETALSVSKDIATYTQHLSSTIDDFRNFFKQDKSKEATNYTNIIKVSLSNRNIKVIQDLQCNDSFMTYANELKQVVINIIKNSQDILSENKIQDAFIEIKTYKDNEKYIIEISDNGGGIKDDIIEKIFDPYFSTKLQKDGTGLGLYMSKIIIEDHCKGKLSCTNTQDGICFRIEL